jgi:DNA-binding PadR family transcriptional regulator
MTDHGLPRLSSLEMFILDLLSEHRQMYGLEMVVASAGRLKRGSVYVTLGRMADKGYITSEEIEGEGQGPPRNVYRMTGHGARVLAAWHTVGAMLAEATR